MLDVSEARQSPSTACADPKVVASWQALSCREGLVFSRREASKNEFL